jgi:hypothetical protein
MAVRRSDTWPRRWFLVGVLESFLDLLAQIKGEAEELFDGKEFGAELGSDLFSRFR